MDFQNECTSAKWQRIRRFVLIQVTGISTTLCQTHFLTTLHNDFCGSSITIPPMLWIVPKDFCREPWQRRRTQHYTKPTQDDRPPVLFSAPCIMGVPHRPNSCVSSDISLSIPRLHRYFPEPNRCTCKRWMGRCGHFVWYLLRLQHLDEP